MTWCRSAHAGWRQDTVSVGITSLKIRTDESTSAGALMLAANVI